MRESRIYESKLVLVPSSCLPHFLFDRTHVPLTLHRSEKEKNCPTILCEKRRWQTQSCAESKVMWFFSSCNVSGGILRSASGNPRRARPVWQCCVFFSTCKAGREASRRTGSVVIQSFIFCKVTAFNLCCQGSNNEFKLLNSW